MSISAWLKGWIGEALGAFTHWAFLDKTIYTALNNITLPTTNGTTQIDHVIVSIYGIFVVEAKNIDGWIFGDPRASQWSVVKPGRKFRIQNPLHQNYRHTRAVVEFLGVEPTQVHSMVMFWGDCEFKTEMPANVMARGYLGYIKGFTTPLLSNEKVVAVVEALRTGALPKTFATHRAHLASLRARHTSTTTCAKCGSPLVLRTVSAGTRAGTKFYGCSTYPRCRHTIQDPGATA
jgi:restriction system protein